VFWWTRRESNPHLDCRFQRAFRRCSAPSRIHTPDNPSKPGRPIFFENLFFENPPARVCGLLVTSNSATSLLSQTVRATTSRCHCPPGTVLAVRPACAGVGCGVDVIAAHHRGYFFRALGRCRSPPWSRVPGATRLWTPAHHSVPVDPCPSMVIRRTAGRRPVVGTHGVEPLLLPAQGNPAGGTQRGALSAARGPASRLRATLPEADNDGGVSPRWRRPRRVRAHGVRWSLFRDSAWTVSGSRAGRLRFIPPAGDGHCLACRSACGECIPPLVR